MIDIRTWRHGKHWIAEVYSGGVFVARHKADTQEEAKELAHQMVRQVREMVRIIDSLPD